MTQFVEYSLPPETPSFITTIWNGITLEYMIKFSVLYFIGVWMFLIFWVARDISHRSQSSILRIFCLLLIILGTPL